jgi:hypothetical protein
MVPDLPRLNFPVSKFRLENRDGKLFIFDVSRKRYVALTPEEWVRQNCLHYLRDHKHFPVGVMAVEKSLILNRQQMRCDIIAYSKQSKPILLVECKAPDVAIDQSTFDQIIVYNMQFKVPYLFVTNGIKHFCCRVDLNSSSISFVDEIPKYHEIKY